MFSILTWCILDLDSVDDNIRGPVQEDGAREGVADHGVVDAGTSLKIKSFKLRNSALEKNLNGKTLTLKNARASSPVFSAEKFSTLTLCMKLSLGWPNWGPPSEVLRHHPSPFIGASLTISQSLMVTSFVPSLNTPRD